MSDHRQKIHASFAMEMEDCGSGLDLRVRLPVRPVPRVCPSGWNQAGSADLAELSFRQIAHSPSWFYSVARQLPAVESR